MDEVKDEYLDREINDRKKLGNFIFSYKDWGRNSVELKDQDNF